MKTKILFSLVFAFGLIFSSLAQKDSIKKVHNQIKANAKKDSIVFVHNPSSEVFDMSKKQGKLIFVDIYTVWCGPCKRMVAQTFKDASVAKVYNENFICYKLDAEQGEGIEFAKKYKVKAYPTYLFLDENGKLVYQSLGYQEPAAFIEEANKALQAAGKKIVSEIQPTENQDTKSESEWDTEYQTNKLNPDFLLKYFAFRKKNGKDNTELLTAYLTACPADSLQNDDNLKLLYHNLTYCNTKSFDIVFKKRDKLIAWYGNEAYNTFSTVIHNSRTKAIRDTNRVLFQKVCAVMSDFQSRYSEQYNSKFAMDFYKITNEIKLYSDAAEMYLNKYVMKINADSVKQRDYQMFARAKRRNPELDSTLLNYVSTIYSKELFDAANVYYEKIEDKDLLIHAMHWAKKAVEFNETYQTLNFYAHLLYKIDVKIDAKVQATKAIEVAKKNKQKYTEAEELLKKL